MPGHTPRLSLGRCVPILCSGLAKTFPLHSLLTSLHHPTLQEDFASQMAADVNAPIFLPLNP